MTRACDVLVVGAGPAGSATAALLASAGHDVLLVDRARFPRAKACAEYVSPGGVAILDTLGALDGLAEPADFRRLRGMLLVAPGGAEHLVQYRGDGTPRLSLAIRRRVLDARLLDVARARGARAWEGARVTGLLRVERAVAGATVQHDGESVTVRARVTVGADGLHSSVVRDLRLRRPVRWPRRLGLVAHVGGVAWPEDHGQMRVGRRGYVGVAPVTDDVVSVGLVRPLPNDRLGSPEAALERGLRDYPEIAERLHSGTRLGAVQGVGPLGHRVHAPAGPGYALVGDAAGFLDPFTGEGLYRALRGAQVVAAEIDRALREHDGPINVGTTYAAARRRVFGPKERLTLLIQAFVHLPPLMDYAIARLRARPALSARLGNVLGDLDSATTVFQPTFLTALLRP